MIPAIAMFQLHEIACCCCCRCGLIHGIFPFFFSNFLSDAVGTGRENMKPGSFAEKKRIKPRIVTSSKGPCESRCRPHQVGFRGVTWGNLGRGGQQRCPWMQRAVRDQQLQFFPRINACNVKGVRRQYEPSVGCCKAETACSWVM